MVISHKYSNHEVIFTFETPDTQNFGLQKFNIYIYISATIKITFKIVIRKIRRNK